MPHLTLPGFTRASRVLVTVAAVAACLLAGAGSAQASTRTWTGANSDLWTDAGNWDTAAPVAGDDLVFPGGVVSHPTNTNDFPAGTNFRSITIGGAYTLNGNAIVLGVNGLQFINLGFPAFLDTVNLPITLGADQTWTNVMLAGNLPTISGAIDLGGHTLTITTQWNIHISGIISGTGALVKSNPNAVLFLEGANSYAGPTTVHGQLVAATPTALGVADGTLANGTIVDSGASLALAGVAVGNEAVSLTGPSSTIGTSAAPNVPSSIAGPITINGSVGIGGSGPYLTVTGLISGAGLVSFGTVHLASSGHTFTSATVTVAGTILDVDNALPGVPSLFIGSGSLFFNDSLTLNGVAQTIGNSNCASCTLALQPVSVLTINQTAPSELWVGLVGDGRIEKTGPSELKLSRRLTSHGIPGTPASTFTGLFNINQGTVTVNGDNGIPATFMVNPNTRLAFATSVLSAENGPITVHGGHLDMQGRAKTGALAMDSASTLDVNVGTLNLVYPVLTVTGGVTLANATLAMQNPLATLDLGGTFTLIDNDGTDPVIGTFKNLPEGAIFVSANQRFRITYRGGTGNDVVLMAADYLFSEGATSDFFTTDLLIANPNTDPAPVAIHFTNVISETRAQNLTLPPMSQKLIRVNNEPGMAGQEFTTVVRSLNGLPLAVERTMSWNSTGYGAHTDHAVDGPAPTWYFAEGSQGFFHTYLLLANRSSFNQTNLATVTYLLEDGEPVVRSYQLAPSSRRTIDLGAEPALANRSFGITVNFTFPGAAERAMYFGDVPLFNGGHESAGVTAPSTMWFLAEGATGPFFETFVLLANPGETDADATLTYLPAAGSPVTVQKHVAAHRRVTINLEQEDPSLANAAVSTQVIATQPILVERAQYWPDPAPNWYEAHNSPGLTSLSKKWGLAEGRVGNVDGVTNAQTFILLANPGTTDTDVTITFLRDNGLPTVTKTFHVPAQKRFNVHVGADADVPELTNEHFGALVVSDQAIAVERAVYWDANGQIWAAGTNATGTPLP
jgi:hypothetical protein